MKSARDEEPDADLAALAKRFLDLWQDQLTALAADPQLAAGMTRFLGALPAAFPFGMADATAGAKSRAARRPEAAAAPSHERGDRLDEFALRLAGLEQRLARLESGAAAAGKRASGRARKRAP